MEGNWRQYSGEFKKDAVWHSLRSEKTIVEIAQDLGIAHSNLNRWRTQYRKNGELAFPGNDKQRHILQEEEIKRLKKELYDVRQERDILKKALAIFWKKTVDSFRFTREHADRLKCHKDVPGAKGSPVWVLPVDQIS